MKTAFDDAKAYLNSSIRTYVNATKTVDKLFAVKLVVLSMIVAVDKLVEIMGIHAEGDTAFHGYIEESSFFLPLAAYEHRMNELYLLEEKNYIPLEYELSRRLMKALDILKIVYGKNGLRSLLSVNFKTFINESQYFIIDIQNILENRL